MKRVVKCWNALPREVVVTIPGDVLETFRCCTEEYDLVSNIGGWMVGLDDIRSPFQPW